MALLARFCSWNLFLMLLGIFDLLLFFVIAKSRLQLFLPGRAVTDNQAITDTAMAAQGNLETVSKSHGPSYPTAPCRLQTIQSNSFQYEIELHPACAEFPTTRPSIGKIMPLLPRALAR
jgi:hypothetical protein